VLVTYAPVHTVQVLQSSRYDQVQPVCEPHSHNLQALFPLVLMASMPVLSLAREVLMPCIL
jgi:hypothetical protein